MNYRIYYDGEMSDIEVTDDEVDGYAVFGTLTEAKHQLLTDLRRTRDGLSVAIRRIRQVQIGDVS